MNKRKTVLFALVTMFLWGSLYPFVKLGFRVYEVQSTADIFFFAGIRFALCGAVITLFAFLRKKESFVPAKQAWFPILLSGVFAIVLHYSFSYLGLQLTNSAKTAILKQIGSLVYICVSAFLVKGARVSWQKPLGALLGFAGVVAINFSFSGFAFHTGDVLILAASFCTVISNVISKRVFAHVHPITATGFSQLFGGVVLLLLGWIMGGRIYIPDFASLWIFLYICVASVISYCIWYITVKDGELSHLFIIKFSEPLFAAIFGAVLLQENIFRIEYLIAFLLITGGICLANIKKKD